MWQKLLLLQFSNNRHCSLARSESCNRCLKVTNSNFSSRKKGCEGYLQTWSFWQKLYGSTVLLLSTKNTPVVKIHQIQIYQKWKYNPRKVKKCHFDFQWRDNWRVSNKSRITGTMVRVVDCPTQLTLICILWYLYLSVFVKLSVVFHDKYQS